jgi:CRISPR-associated protein Cas1
MVKPDQNISWYAPGRHPIFGYRISYRRVIEVQARLLAATLVGEIPRYVPFTTR